MNGNANTFSHLRHTHDSSTTHPTDLK